jgi:hypothetical protein
VLCSFAKMAFDGKTQRVGTTHAPLENISWPSASFSMPRFIFLPHTALASRFEGLSCHLIVFSVGAHPHMVNVISEA